MTIILPSRTDDLPRSFLLDELFGRAGIAIEDAEEVDVENATDVFFRKVQGFFDLSDACIGDHNVQRAKSVDRFLDHALDVLQTRHIGHNPYGFPPQAFNFLDDLKQ